MKRTHLPLNALRVFDAAARHLSFTRAADELAVTPAAVGQQIRALEDIVGEFETHVFSAPFAEMDSPITIVSWGFRMPLDEIDEPAIKEFIDEFREKGPEEQPCPSDSDDAFPEPDAGDTPNAEVTIPPDGQETPAPEGKKGTPTPDGS